MEFPEKREMVICKVKKILPYGVIVDLEEFNNTEGFVSLNQVASKWVKNIRNFVKVGQIKVGKVVYINYEKKQINISFAYVSDVQEKQKINEWRLTKRVQQLLEILAKKKNESLDSIWDKIVNPILEKYNSVYDAFKDISIYGKDYVPEIEEKYREDLYNLLKKNIIIKEKGLKEEITLETSTSDGVEKIKKTFLNIPKEENISLKINYKGNGKYLLIIKAIKYKILERYLTKINDYLQKQKKGFDKLEIKKIK